jgi:pimeloyl-ACP methyl ester carboxylesterase
MVAFDAALAAVDLAGFPSPVRLAPTLRPTAAFAWCAHGDAESEVAPGVVRADYRLAALHARGAVRPEVAAAFTEATALADLGFSLYASRDRLGAPSDPTCLARAVDLVALLPGWGATRAVWRDVAAAVCRDNARAVVIALDLWGVGASTYRAAPSRAQADAAAVVAATLRCLGALGLATLPAVVVGHSLSATALLALGDAALGEGRTAVPVSPVFPAHCERYRARVRTGVRLMATVGRLPGGKEWLLRALARDAPSVQDVTPTARAAMFDNLRAIPAAALARTLDALGATPRFDGAPRHRVQLLLGASDPLVTPEALAAATRDLGLLPSQVTQLATGGHYPHLESATHPEWTARNLAEIGHIITRMTLAAGEVSAASAEAFSSTVVEVRSPDASADAWGSAETLCATAR